MRDALRLLLEEHGYAVVGAGTLASALALARERRFDAALLDLGLPDGDGLELLDALRIRADESLPVIVVTGREEAGSVRRAFLAGASDFVRKPLDAAELLVRLEAATRRGRDAEARRSLEAELAAAQEQAREQLARELERAQRLEPLGFLAGATAHDFNNILTAIVGFTEVGLRHQGVPAEVRKNLGEVQRAAERAAELTQQLLSYSRGQSSAPAGPLVIDEVVSRLLPLLQQLTRDRVAVVTRLAAPHLRVVAETARIEQVLANLVANARDAMPEGGSVTIATAEHRVEHAADAALPAGRWLALGVADTGVGMSDEVKARIFQPFFTTKGESGTGLGLAVVERIVRGLGGRIRVESAPGRGTEFSVLLPAV